MGCRAEDHMNKSWDHRTEKSVYCSTLEQVFVFEVCLSSRQNKRPKAIVTSGASLDPIKAILKELREEIGAVLISYAIEEKHSF